jgi:hypothetical protein
LAKPKALTGVKATADVRTDVGGQAETVFPNAGKIISHGDPLQPGAMPPDVYGNLP